MKCYRTHKKSRLVALILSIPLLVFGSAGIILFLVNFNIDSFIVLISSSPFLYLARFLIGRNFVSICLGDDKFIIKRALYKKESYKLSHINEIVLISYLKQYQRPNHMPGGSPQATGRAAGHVLLAISQNASKNSYSNKQLAIKFNDKTIVTLNSNYMNDSIELVEQLSQKSGVDVKIILLKEFNAWKKGQLEKYRNRLPSKLQQKLPKIEAFYKQKWILLTPLLLSVIVVIILNIWFNLTHYNIKKMTKDEIDNHYFVSKNKVEDSDGDITVDILSSNGNKLLSGIFIHEGRFLTKESDTVFHYSFYPFQNPYHLSRILNLDDDEEPEILFKASDFRDDDFKVYDFNASSQSFDIKTVRSFSPKLERYIVELKGHKSKQLSKTIGQFILVFLLIYYVSLFILHTIVSEIKKLD